MEVDSLAARLEAVRRARTLTQEGLAARSGVSRVVIARIEAGSNTVPRGSTVRKLAVALGVEPAWLLWGDEGEELLGKAVA